MSKRILVVDDEPSVRESLAMLLMIDGHTVMEACDAEAGLKFLEVESFDIVMTDYKMPKMLGSEFAAAVKGRLPSQRIIMVTAHPVPPPGPDNPVEAVLQKPFNLEQLRCVVEGSGSASTKA